MIDAVQRAAAATAEFNQVRAVWGLYPGRLEEYPLEEAWSLVKEISRLPEYAALTRLIAELSDLVVKWRGHKPQPAPLPQNLTGIATGRSLEHLTPFELVKLADPDMEDLFHDSFEHQALLHYSFTGKRQETAPPLICCLDTSASMNQPAARGLSRLAWGKAVTLALHNAASQERRPFHAICFSTVGQTQIFSAPGGRLAATDVLALAKCHLGGGTHFETPLDAAVQLTAAAHAGTGDMVMITDGEAPLAEDYVKRFVHDQRRLSLHMYAMFIDGHHDQLAALSRQAFSVASADEHAWRGALSSINRQLAEESR